MQRRAVEKVSVERGHDPGRVDGAARAFRFSPFDGVEALPPSRDSFGLALAALRQRLRDGVDAPGAALPINLIAAELKLSPTPVREALSRLAGEQVVEKRGPAYTRPQLDSLTLAELYALRLLYLSAAMAGAVDRRVRRRLLPPREPFEAAASLALRPQDPGEVIEALFLEIVLRADDLILGQAYQRAANRLAPFQAQEAQAFTDLATEAFGLAAAFDLGDASGLRAGVRAHHKRRIAAADAITRLASGVKYRPDIV